MNNSSGGALALSKKIINESTEPKGEVLFSCQKEVKKKWRIGKI